MLLCIYDFRADHFVVDNQLQGLSLGKKFSYSQYSLVAYSSLSRGPMNFSASLLVCLLVLSMFKVPCCLVVMGAAFLSFLRETLSHHTS